ncbi:heterokaryon incompatibility protein-domain-containing protein [Pyrenochaeta sp. MPI-SDFR-AT-0127]|nr:heterokaryon incompatibility protein-domain-containing protein [Pyrenochaeta sp. MPI-SDFR-AT-0127]
MPLPKSLRRPVRRTSSSSSAGQTQRKKCRTCNSLDPRGHANSIYLDDAAKEPKASLSLVLDALSLANTKDVARGGCRFCNVLIVAIDTFLENWRGARVRVNVELKEKTPIKVSLDGEKWKNEVLEIYAGSASRSPWPTLGTAHHIPVNSGSDETFDFIRRCIQGCIANPKHTACRFLCKSSISSPKRLLDVGRASSPIRLIDTQGKSFQYVALSHCWGSATQLRATKSNWTKLAVNISFNALPPLFQDAIIITRQLGLRYIWIDSLCIIQDSLRDWETESSKMGSIYQNSYITISATNSGDGSAKCLSERRKPVKIPYENTTKKEFALRARKILDHHPTSSPGGGPARPVGPLTFRAWALQEHVLSTRILHYTATELLFECKTSYRCECMPERKAYPTTPSLIPKAVASKKVDAVWQAWQRIVEQYSVRELTVPGDKLPAISGIASKIRKATHSDYLAGLWKGNLASDLLWHATPPTSVIAGNFVLDTWRAPSFSWASLDAPITYTVLDEEERETFAPMITLLASKIVARGLNPLGTISEGSLTVRGSTISATLSAAETLGKWEYILLIKGTSTIRITQDCFLIDANFKTEEEGQQTTVRRAQSKDILRQFKAPVLCLSVARYDNFIAGLVLGVSSLNHGAWERVGTFAAGSEPFQRGTEKEVIIV